MNTGAASGSGSAYQVTFVVQPDRFDHRFRYEREGRGNNYMKGAGSAHPIIQITGPEEKHDLMLKISCVSAEPPHYIHAHSLIGEHCKLGYYFSTGLPFDGTKTVVLPKLRIQRVKRHEIEDALEQRMKDNIDPFRQGFAHSEILKRTDRALAVVRLCVQVYKKEGKNKKLLCWTLSDPVFDKQQMPKLAIQDYSPATASFAGGEKIIILCDKVNKKDIRVDFYTEFQGKRQDIGEAEIKNVFKGFAVVITTPKFNTSNEVSENVSAFMQLHRTSDGTSSEPMHFQFTPEKCLQSHSLEKFLLSELGDGVDFYCNEEIDSFLPSTRLPHLEERTNHTHNHYNITPTPPECYGNDKNDNRLQDIQLTPWPSRHSVQTQNHVAPFESPGYDPSHTMANSDSIEKMLEYMQPTAVPSGVSEPTQNNVAPFASPSLALGHHPSHTTVDSVSIEKKLDKDELFPGTAGGNVLPYIQPTAGPLAGCVQTQTNIASFVLTSPPLDYDSSYTAEHVNHDSVHDMSICYSMSTMSVSE